MKSWPTIIYTLMGGVDQETQRKQAKSRLQTQSIFPWAIVLMDEGRKKYIGLKTQWAFRPWSGGSTPIDIKRQRGTRHTKHSTPPYRSSSMSGPKDKSTRQKTRWNVYRKAREPLNTTKGAVNACREERNHHRRQTESMYKRTELVL